MEFTKDQLMVIEEALMIARYNSGEEKWADKIWSVLNEVRSKLTGRNDIIVRRRITSEIEKLRKNIDELKGELEDSCARLARLEKEEKKYR